MNTFEMISPVRRFCGIDFSGAKDAGKKIWIAEGAVEGNLLLIDECRRVQMPPVAGRDLCLAWLREFIAKGTDSVFGLDFPFGLPSGMITEKSWEDFVIRFPEHYQSAGDFRDKCRKASDRELKRATDRESKTPFSPYNLRVYRQTYYGIRDILSSLVQERKACVLPMQRPQHGMPLVIEICPASTLKKLNLYRPYKGRGMRSQRERILEALAGFLSIRPGSVRENILDDNGGDALDSVIAAYAAFCAWRNSFAVEMNENYSLEGYVFT